MKLNKVFILLCAITLFISCSSDDDSVQPLSIKEQQLKVINASRAAHGAPPVLLDELASQVADEMARHAAEEKLMGHYNLDGEKPYMRYAKAGGYDHVTENAAAYWSSDDFNGSDEHVLNTMKELHAAFMAEKAPNDGHKQAVINKNHTHVGIGMAWDGKQFRYYEEYLDRYLEFKNISQSVSTSKAITFSIRPLSAEHYIHAFAVLRESLPNTMTANEASSHTYYMDGGDQYLVEAVSKMEEDNEGWFSYSFTPGKTGYYYVQIFLDSKPFEGSFSSAGKIQASGLGFFVNE
jgi:uncharacterized protein YkwD